MRSLIVEMIVFESSPTFGMIKVKLARDIVLGKNLEKSSYVAGFQFQEHPKGEDSFLEKQACAPHCNDGCWAWIYLLKSFLCL
mmetsp:Transcript_12997/g.18170  ORF Transcript_12997/g.18170 Transcript_12997/m.18170 type:complete len:83 (+) Transcript_12997:3271-3519(+)